MCLFWGWPRHWKQSLKSVLLLNSSRNLNSSYIFVGNWSINNLHLKTRISSPPDAAPRICNISTRCVVHLFLSKTECLSSPTSWCSSLEWHKNVGLVAFVVAHVTLPPRHVGNVNKYVKTKKPSRPSEKLWRRLVGSAGWESMNCWSTFRLSKKVPSQLNARQRLTCPAVGEQNGVCAAAVVHRNSCRALQTRSAPPGPSGSSPRYHLHRVAANHVVSSPTPPVHGWKWPPYLWPQQTAFANSGNPHLSLQNLC